jgi:hypothetical protein
MIFNSNCSKRTTQTSIMVDKAIVIENKIKEMEKDGKRKVSFHGQPTRSNVMPRFSQPNQFFKPPEMNWSQMPMHVLRSQFQIQQPNFQAQRLSFQMQRSQQQAPRPNVQQPSRQNMQQGATLMLQPRRMHQLKEVIMVELVSSAV